MIATAKTKRTIHRKFKAEAFHIVRDLLDAADRKHFPLVAKLGLLGVLAVGGAHRIRFALIFFLRFFTRIVPTRKHSKDSRMEEIKVTTNLGRRSRHKEILMFPQVQQLE